MIDDDDALGFLHDGVEFGVARVYIYLVKPFMIWLSCISHTLKRDTVYSRISSVLLGLLGVAFGLLEVAFWRSGSLCSGLDLDRFLDHELLEFPWVSLGGSLGGSSWMV